MINSIKYLYSIELYIGITTTMCLALSICVFFILLMESVNGAQVLNITSLSLLFSCTCAAAMFATNIIPYIIPYICITIIK